MKTESTNNTEATVIVKKVIRASRERIFEAWTKPEIMNQWYVGGEGCARTAVDLRVGGKYINEMLISGEATCESSQAKTEGSQSYLHHGEYLKIEYPSKLMFTWNSPSVQGTTVTVDLREVRDGTEVTITHQLHKVESCEGHQEGWTFALNKLATTTESR
jgi:uncharacterized protein YndB with AHSA1/START domain